jgi:hypothetical protein
MTKERKDAIENLAETILKVLHHDDKLSPNIDEIIYELGGKVTYDEKADCSVIHKRGEDSFEIVVKPTPQIQNEKAHCLGITLIYMGYMTNPERWKNQYSQKDNLISYPSFDTYHSVSADANFFVMNILMPRKSYKKAVDFFNEGKTVNIEKLAHTFNVNISQARMRGKQLELLK